MLRRLSSLVLALSAGLTSAFVSVARTGRAGELDVSLNEVHYHPFSSALAADIEFVEIYNSGPTAVSLAGWELRRGIEFRFPSGASIAPGEYLVVSPDPDAATAAYSLRRVEGPYDGRLSDGGETIELVNAAGHCIDRVHYDDRDPWPRFADGLGASLEFVGTGVDDTATTADPHRWRASISLDGTPGRPNSRRRDPDGWRDSVRRSVLAAEAPRRFLRGAGPPPREPLAWYAPDFDDDAWTNAEGGIGYGTAHGFAVGTTVDDMRSAYSSVFVRARFSITAEQLDSIRSDASSLRLRVSFDDAYVAYLNGVEVTRTNIGIPRQEPPYDALANEARSGVEDTILDVWVNELRDGGNVLALHGVNESIPSDDFFIGAEIFIEEATSVDPGPLESASSVAFLREVIAPVDGFGWRLELANPTNSPRDLTGFEIRTSEGDEATIGPVADLAPGEHRVLDIASLGLPAPRVATTWALIAPDDSLVDAMRVPELESGTSYGRSRFDPFDELTFAEPTPGVRPSPGASQAGAIVLAEIQFHPPKREDGTPSDDLQWIEIENRSPDPVDVSDWALRRGVRFSLPTGTTLDAGERAVIAADRAAFLAEHADVDPTVVLGDWEGRLSHASEVIELVDASGARVDRVEYSDGGPVNDVSPDDGIDDGTFRGSDWPAAADGTGRSVELVHPALDNALGASWLASRRTGGSPGAENSTHRETPHPAIGGVAHSPILPTSDDNVRVTARVSSVLPLSSVELEWSLDGLRNPTRIPMRDDGLDADAEAGDGVYSTRIPPQTAGELVRYTLRAQNAEGAVRYPAAPTNLPYAEFEGPFLLYRVDETQAPPNGSPTYHVWMTEHDRDELRGRSLTSDVLLPATVARIDAEGHVAIRQRVGLRYRGESSRREPNRSFRLALAPEARLDGRRRLNLNGSNGGIFNSQNLHELLAMDLFRRAGEPHSLVRPINLRFPGIVFRSYDSRYVEKEAFDGSFLNRMFDDGSDGDLFRARSPQGSEGPSGNLTYLGDDPAAYRDFYEHEEGDDPSALGALIELIRTFDPIETPDEVFASRVESTVDVEQWVRFFAIFALLTNADGGIWNEDGEDYFLYRVPTLSTHPQAGRWLLCPWDVEETLADANERLFRPSIPAIRRLLSHPRFAPVYYRELDRLSRGVFARPQIERRLGFAGVLFPPDDAVDVRDEAAAYVSRRLGYLEENVASTLTSGPSQAANDKGLTIPAGAEWRFHRGQRPPDGDLLDWTRREYDDANWEVGPSGFGVGDDDDATVLSDLPGSYSTVYIRSSFRIDDPTRVTSLTLWVDYDDAFVAYLNGTEVARSATAPPAGPVFFDDTALGSHEATGTGRLDAEGVDRIDIGAARESLRAGDNVLAIVGLNDTIGSRDFTLLPGLGLSTRENGLGLTGGCGRILFAQGERLEIGGFADPVRTRSVALDGVPVDSRWVTDGDGPYGLSWSTTLTLRDPDTPAVDVVVTAHPDGAARDDAIEFLDVQVRTTDSGFRTVRGELKGDVTWTPGGGPYRLSGDVTVPAESTLRVDAGTAILGDAGSRLIVDGRLLMEGTADDPILARSFSCGSAWFGIWIRDTGTDAGAPEHELAFIDFDGGAAHPSHDGFVQIERARVAVRSCTFRAIQANALDATDSRLDVRDTRFESVFEGAHFTRSSAHVAGCTFRALVGDRDALDFDGDGPERSRVEGCTFAGGIDDGIDVGNASLDVIDCVFRDFADKAISIEGMGAHGGPSLRSNLIHDCSVGVSIKDGARVDDAHHNTVTRCRRGIEVLAKDTAQGAQASFHSSIVWGNVVDVTVDASSTMGFRFSNVGPDLPWPGEGNVAVSPRFVAPGSADFRLAPDSPLIGGGENGTDMGAIPFTGRPEGVFLRGDANESGRVDISDAIVILDHLFLGGVAPPCEDRLDATDNGRVDITDAIFALRYLFLGGDVLPPPFPDPGPDPTDDALPCPP